MGGRSVLAMTPPPVVLVLLDDAALRGDAERIAAAVGLRPVHPGAVSRTLWLAAAAVLLDEAAARRCAAGALPRRRQVILLTASEPTSSAWAAAVEVGAQRLCVLPAAESSVVRLLAEAAETESQVTGGGRLIAVASGRGGGGASVFAAALALTAETSLLVDLDPYAAGIDLLLGAESTPGLRWPDIDTGGGRLSWPAVRDALPARRGVRILSGTRQFHDLGPSALLAVLDAAQRAGVPAVCDMPRQVGPAATAAVERADLVCVMTPCDVRGIAGAAVLIGALRPLNPNLGLVVRGPAPGGLLPADAATVTGAPVLAAMRADPAIAAEIERGGLRVPRRSRLAVAARTVLDMVADRPEASAA